MTQICGYWAFKNTVLCLTINKSFIIASLSDVSGYNVASQGTLRADIQSSRRTNAQRDLIVLNLSNDEKDFFWDVTPCGT
jgi:hypothetical protein